MNTAENIKTGAPQPNNNGALRYDDNKPPVSLIPPQVILELAKVCGYGANKYAPHNWEKGMDWSRMYDSASRHLLAWASGETFDAESGQRTLAHAVWNLAGLLYYEMYGIGVDDRTFTKKQPCAQDPTPRQAGVWGSVGPEAPKHEVFPTSDTMTFSQLLEFLRGGAFKTQAAKTTKEPGGL